MKIMIFIDFREIHENSMITMVFYDYNGVQNIADVENAVQTF